MIVTFWPNLRTPHGARRELSWDALCETLADPRPYQGDAHPGWSPAEFRGDKRAKDGVERVWALCLDQDHGMSVEQALARMADMRLGGFLHTTRKHTPTAHRFRVVVPLSRPVSGFEFEALWGRVAPQFGPVDPNARDQSRFWFLPGCPDPETFHSESIPGPELDVDEWLSRPEPRHEPERSAPPRPTTPLAERARQYVAKMPEAISGSSGHKAAFRVAVVLVRGFELDDDTALAILTQDYNPRCQPAWKRKELAHKVESARALGRMPFGEIARRGNDWRPDWEAGYEPAEANDEGVDEEREAIQEEANPETADDDPAGKWRVVFLRDACAELLDEIGSNQKTVGCTLGNYELDAALAGVRSEHVIGWGAPTSWGKSSAAVMVTDENLLLHNGVLIVGCEDSSGMYARRVLQRRGSINAIRMRDNRCSPDEVAKAAHEVARMKNQPFLIPAVGMHGEKIALAIRDLVPALGIKLVIVDYIQRVRLQRRTQDRRNEVTLAAEMIANAIKTAGAGGIILSQLKRLEPGRRPTMSDLKETGDLENMCEHVLVGWKETDVQERTIHKVGVEKNKDGPAGGEVFLPFNFKTASFETVSTPERFDDGFDDTM